MKHHCPECGAVWPEHLRFEHDMLEIETFEEVEGTRAWALASTDREYLDTHSFYCTACLNGVSVSAEGLVLSDWYDRLCGDPANVASPLLAHLEALS